MFFNKFRFWRIIPITIDSIKIIFVCFQLFLFLELKKVQSCVHYLYTQLFSHIKLFEKKVTHHQQMQRLFHSFDYSPSLKETNHTTTPFLHKHALPCPSNPTIPQNRGRKKKKEIELTWAARSPTKHTARSRAFPARYRASLSAI